MKNLGKLEITSPPTCLPNSQAADSVEYCHIENKFSMVFHGEKESNSCSASNPPTSAKGVASRFTRIVGLASTAACCIW